MGSFADDIRDLRRIEAAIGTSSVEGSLVLVDLAGSTPYKTRNGEAAWLGRLLDFYDAVKRALSPLEPTKYLGDGVLGFYEASSVEPLEVMNSVRRVFDEIDSINEQRYRGDHAIQVRAILGFGKAYLFNGNDPQGTPVDQLFRMEKHVPDGCIGLTNEFRAHVGVEETTDIGRIALRGLAGGRHRLVVLGRPEKHAKGSIDRARRRAALRDIWDLGRGGGGPVFLISGYIPPEPGHPSSIQLGDKDAVIMAYQNLAQIGRIADTEVMTSRDARDANLRENVVCIGGPYWNKVTLRFMREVRAPFVFDFSDSESDETPIINCLTEDTYRDVWSGDRLCRDFGFFARFRNPLNPERHVILACGIETQAVAGIVEAFSEDQTEFLHLHKVLPRAAPTTEGEDLAEFFCLMPFEIEDTGLAHMPARDDQIGEVISDWDRSLITNVQQSPAD